MGTCSSMRSFEKRQDLIINIKTWPESNAISLSNKQNFIERNVNLYLFEGQNIQIFLKGQVALPQKIKQQDLMNAQRAEDEGLLCLIQRGPKEYIFRFLNNRQKSKLWKVVRQESRIFQGDIFRIGHTSFRLAKFITAENSQLKNYPQSELMGVSNIANPGCRICLSTAQTQKNPLISPCRCQGSVQFVHMNCLSDWLFGKTYHEQQQVKIKYNKTTCQLCKTDITNTKEYHQMVEHLLHNSLVDTPVPFAIFQIYHNESERLSNYHCFSFAIKQQYLIGRGNNADIVDKNDNLISKSHCTLSYKNEQVLIRDMNSLHGTYKEMVHQIKLNKMEPFQEFVYKNMMIKIKSNI